MNVHQTRTSPKPSPLRIAFVPEYYYPYTGGGENWFREIASALMKRGHDVVVFAFPMAGVPRRELIDGIPVIRVGFFKIESWQPYLKRTVSHLISFFRHPVYSHGANVVVGQGSALLAVFPVLWATRTPMVCVVHDLYGLNQSIRDKGLIKGLARYIAVERILHRMPFAAWVAVSESTKAKLRTLGVPASKIIIVRNGVNQPPKLAQGPADRNAIVFLGRLVKHKHPEDFLTALSLIKTDMPWVAKIVGDGELLPELKQLAKELGLEERVQFTGKVSEDEKWKLLSSSTCLVLPSMAEGWGVVLTEAAAAGTPSVTYDIPGTREQAEIVPSIHLVKQRDARGLAIWIQKLLEDTELRKSLGRTGVEAATRLTWKASAELTERLLMSIAS